MTTIHRNIFCMVLADALLLDARHDEDGPETHDIRVWGDGEYACMIAESHLDDGTEDGKIALNGVVLNHKSLKRVIQALQSAEDYRGQVHG